MKATNQDRRFARALLGTSMVDNFNEPGRVVLPREPVSPLLVTFIVLAALGVLSTLLW